jgi:hypothetical protein
MFKQLLEIKPPGDEVGFMVGFGCLGEHAQGISCSAQVIAEYSLASFARSFFPSKLFRIRPYPG